MITATLDLKFLDRMAIGMRKTDLRPAWKRARKPLKRDQRDRQKQGVTSDGSRWPARAASTRAHDKSAGRRPSRKLLGRLVNATSIKSELQRAILGSVVRWAGVQFSGGTVGHRAQIPARRFLGVSKPVLWLIAKFVSQEIAAASRKVR